MPSSSPLPPISPKSSESVLLVGTETVATDDLAQVRSTLTEQSADLRFELLPRLPTLALPQKTFDHVVLGYPEALSPSSVPSTLWSKLLEAAKPGATLCLGLTTDLTTEDKDTLSRALRSSGWTKVDIVDFSLRAQSPSYSIGATSRLSLSSSSSSSSTSSRPKRVWKKASTSRTDLIDEDDLLDEEDRAKPSAASLARPDDCSTKRKACKNCSCGRAEMESESSSDKQALSVGDVAPEQPTSSCGNCYLGDAFRCGSCPYLGLPAFQPGQKVSLTGSSMLADDLP